MALIDIKINAGPKLLYSEEDLKRKLEIQEKQINERWRMKLRHQATGVFRLPLESEQLIAQIEPVLTVYSAEEAKEILS